MTNLTQLRHRVDKIKSSYDLAFVQVRSESIKLSDLEARTGFIKEAQDVTQGVAQVIQQQAHEKIAKVVTACLQTVFPDMNYEFKLKFERKRNRTEATPVLIKDGHELENPYDKTERDNKSSESGGVLDVAGFTCQVAAIMLSKPAIRLLFVMDEPFKGVAVEYRDGLRQMIEMLARDFGIQFVLVTHMTELETGKVIKL